MELKIANNKIDFYNQVEVNLNYESVGSTFSFYIYFDPENALHKEICRPGAFHPVTISHNGELLITGTLLYPEFEDGAKRSLVPLSGYSKTGILEDCETPTNNYPLQSNNLSLKQIAEKAIKPFGLKLLVDASVASKANKAILNSTADDKQTIKSYLAELAGQRHIILSHDEKGNLLLTQANTTQAPIFDFTAGMPGVKYRLGFNGQRMHNTITLQKQGTKTGKGNAGLSSIQNPYVSIFKPTVKRQTSGNDIDTKDAVRNMLSDELKNIYLEIELDRWELDGKIVRPNNIITITNPNLYLYNKTRFFITTVEFRGDNIEQTARLSLVLPEVYSGQIPKNIFA